MQVNTMRHMLLCAYCLEIVFSQSYSDSQMQQGCAPQPVVFSTSLRFELFPGFRFKRGVAGLMAVQPTSPALLLPGPPRGRHLACQSSQLARRMASFVCY